MRSMTAARGATTLGTLVLLACLAGCHSYKSDMQNICNAESLSGVAGKDLAPEQRALELAKWLEKNVHTAKAKEVFASLASVAPDQKGPIVRKAAEEAGVSPCPWADAEEKAADAPK